MSDYCTLNDIKLAMPDVFGSTTTSYDNALQELATRASRMIDGVFGQEDNAFVAQAAAAIRYYNGTGMPFVYIDPCTSITTVAVKGGVTSATYDAWVVDTDYDKAAGGYESPAWNAGYYTLLIVPPGIGRVFTYGRKTVKVTAFWGRTATVPDLIKQATCIQTGRWFKRGQQAFQDVAGQAGMGELTYAQKLDPDIAEMLIKVAVSTGGAVMPEITVTIKGLDELVQKLGDAKVRKLALVRMRNASLIAEREAKHLAPVDMGRLKASITSEAHEAGSDVIGTIGSSVTYAPYVELGTRPHFVPAQYIGGWAARHGFGNTGLPVSGKAQPYLKPAIENKMSEITDQLKKTLDDIKQKLGG